MATEIETDVGQFASRTTQQLELRILINIYRGQNCAARVHFAIKGLNWHPYIYCCGYKHVGSKKDREIKYVSQITSCNTVVE